jgi:hypothetical protein
VDKITGKISTGYQFFTRSLPCLNIYWELFYPQGTKVIPNNIAQHLTARGLALWLMQDGSKTTDNGIIFAKQWAIVDCPAASHSNPCLLNLVLIVHYKKRGAGNQKAIYVRRASIPTFIELVTHISIPLCSTRCLLSSSVGFIMGREGPICYDHMII